MVGFSVPAVLEKAGRVLWAFLAAVCLADHQLVKKRKAAAAVYGISP
jgi:hypothetical protein